VVAADYFRLAGLAGGDSRLVEIVNGVDEADLEQASGGPPSDRFVLAHVGSIYEIRDPTPALRALGSLVSRGVVDADQVEVRLVGNLWIPGFAPPPGISVIATGYVSHEDAIEEMVAATVLLLYIAPRDLAPSGKLFEYLASGRPLLCLAPEENLASRIVRDWGAGVVAGPQDEEAIEEAITMLWRRWRAEGLPQQDDVRSRVFEQYSRRAGAARLADVLEDARRD
jgi:glycosyltransferase involved in cell wall biosynthesis